MLRVNHLIQREISEMLQKDMDPRFGMITITEVRVSKDLRYAKVFFSVYGENSQKEKATRFLHEKTASIQKELGSRIRLRYTPSLQFILDETAEKTERIMNLFKDLHLEENSKNG
jgi:ribosome-binding factor A